MQYQLSTLTITFLGTIALTAAAATAQTTFYVNGSPDRLAIQSLGHLIRYGNRTA